MNEERTRKCLRQVEHIRGRLWHIFSVIVNQVMTKSINKMNCFIFTLAQVQKNPASASQESNALFTAGISSLIISVLAIVFVIVFVLFCRKC
jgi:hypothetical protein